MARWRCDLELKMAGFEATLSRTPTGQPCAESAHHGEWNDVLAAAFHLDLSRIGVCLGRRLASARFGGTKKDFCSIGAGMKVTEVGSRSSLRRMALAWADLADQAERNSRSDVVYEPPERERRQG
jgi:hypothetical protein